MLNSALSLPYLFNRHTSKYQLISQCYIMNCSTLHCCLFLSIMIKPTLSVASLTLSLPLSPPDQTPRCLLLQPARLHFGGSTKRLQEPLTGSSEEFSREILGPPRHHPLLLIIIFDIAITIAWLSSKNCPNQLNNKNLNFRHTTASPSFAHHHLCYCYYYCLIVI